MTRLLVLTAGFGEGHNAAARNLAAAHAARHGADAVTVADTFALASPQQNAVARSAYLGLINRAPGIWRRFYAWLDRNPPLPRYGWALRGPETALRKLLAEQRPGVIACTYPIYAYWLLAWRGRGEIVPPVVNIVTDSISIHTLWTRPPCDAWVVPNEATSAVVRGLGVPRARIHALGFPVPLRLDELAGQLAPPSLAAGARPRVLMVVHSCTAGAEATAAALLGQRDWEITLTVGRDEGLRRRLARAAQGRAVPTEVLGWTDRMPELLLSHHVLVSKAGGATTQEAIAAGCPMAVNRIVPGQEEGNFQLLRDAGAGVYAQAPAEVVAALRGAFADRGRQWSVWRAALASLAKPRAAASIVDFLSREGWRTAP